MNLYHVLDRVFLVRKGKRGVIGSCPLVQDAQPNLLIAGISRVVQIHEYEQQSATMFLQQKLKLRLWGAAKTHSLRLL